MNIFVCLDEHGGMSFNQRRQSMDRVIRENMLQTIGESNLYVNSYTAKQFKEDNEKLVVDDSCLETAETNAYVFVENCLLGEYVSNIEKIIVYRWKRDYPADLFFDIDLTVSPWKLLESKEFVGYSHECIGKEIYSKE